MLKEYTHQRCLKNETLPLGFWKDCRSLVHGEWRESSAWIHRSTESLSTMVKAVVSISIMFAWKNLWGSSVPYIAHTELYTELNGFTRLLESWNQSAILLCIVKNNGWNVHRHSHTWVVTVSTTHTHTHTHTASSFPSVSRCLNETPGRAEPWRLSGAQGESPAVMRDRKSHKLPVSGQVGTTGSFHGRCGGESGSACRAWGGGILDARRVECLGRPSLTWEEYCIVLFWTGWTLCTLARVHAMTFPSEIFKCLECYSAELILSNVPPSSCDLLDSVRYSLPQNLDTRWDVTE